MKDLFKSFSCSAQRQRQPQRPRPAGRRGQRRSGEKNGNSRQPSAKQFRKLVSVESLPDRFGLLALHVCQASRGQNRSTESRNRRFCERRFAKFNRHRIEENNQLAGESSQLVKRVK